jgi:hypothetical protein
VGRWELAAVNRKEDVLLVQRLLKQAAKVLRDPALDPKSESGTINKDATKSNTIKAMEAFQRRNGRKATGLFYPRGKSITKLLVLGTPVAWGAKVSLAFKERVFQICAELAVKPDYLMACMAFESAETFRPNIRNPKSNAVGLIQFMGNTAKSLGTTTNALAGMTAVRQLDYVRKYFWPYRGRLRSLEDVYLAIFTPAAIGKPADYKLYKKGTKAYSQNIGFDQNKDGAISLAEISTAVRAKYNKGLLAGYIG